MCAIICSLRVSARQRLFRQKVHETIFSLILQFRQALLGSFSIGLHGPPSHRNKSYHCMQRYCTLHVIRRLFSVQTRNDKIRFTLDRRVLFLVSGLAGLCYHYSSLHRYNRIKEPFSTLLGTNMAFLTFPGVMWNGNYLFNF